MRIIHCCKSGEIGKTNNPQVLLVIFIHQFISNVSAPFRVILSEHKINDLPLKACHL